MKRMRGIMSFLCFLIGYIALAVGLLMAVLGLLSVGDPAHPIPIAETLYQALPGAIVAVVAVCFLITARALDPSGPVLRREKREPNTVLP